MKNILFVVSGPSGSGKNTLLDFVMKNRPNLVHSVSATTRSPRFFEKNEIDYYFKTKDEFKSLIENDGLIEWDTYNGNYYGTLVSDVDKKISEGHDVAFDITVKGAYNVKRIYGESSKSVFILPPSVKILKQRLLDRQSEEESVINKRIAVAIEDEIAKALDFDYFLLNNDLEKAMNDMMKIYDSVASSDYDSVSGFETGKNLDKINELIESFRNEVRELGI